MILQRRQAQVRISDLHTEARRLWEMAAMLPVGLGRDDHWMRAERLADLAWSIEEQSELDPVPSGLWP